MRIKFAHLCLGQLLIGIAVMAQPAQTGSISGRITIGDGPADGVIVSLEGGPADAYSTEREGLITRTSDNGNYRFDNVPKGRHLVVPRADAYVLPTESGSIQAGRFVTIAPGDNVEGVNFDLVPGGVITGRIIDHTGRPVINERIQVWIAATNSKPRPYRNPNSRMFRTDDLGVYRIYGMPAGKYVVGVGTDPKESGISIFSGTERSIPYSPLVYYPGVRAAEDAKILNLEQGKAITDIDIVMLKPEKTYLVKGRVFDEENRAPVPGAGFGYGLIVPGLSSMRVYGYGGQRTGENGEYVIHARAPGNYAVYIRPDSQSEYYADQVSFEITDHDIENLDITARKGGSISGRIEVQSLSFAEVFTRGVRISGVNSASPNSPTQIGGGEVNPDGSFTVNGLMPGRVDLSLKLPPGIKVLKMERDGVRLTNGIQLGSGEKVTGVKVSLATGIGIIKGQLNLDSGKLPDGIGFYVSGFRIEEPSDTISPSGGAIFADSLGRFTVDGLLPGDYEITVTPLPTIPGATPVNGLAPQKKTVSVGSAPAAIVFNFDLSKARGNLK